MADSDTYFLEVTAHVSLKVATNNSFRDKKTMNIYYLLGYFSKAKLEECDLK